MDNARLPKGRTLPEHEDFIRFLQDMVDQALEGRLPTMGTVKGDDGGKVRVQLDTEDEERALGFPKKVGQRYKQNDRVMCVPTRSGEFAVLGTISSASGEHDQAIADEDIYDEGVSGSKLKKGTITGDRIKGGEISGGHIAKNSINASELANGSVVSDTINANAVDKKHLSGQLTQELNDKAEKSQLSGLVSNDELNRKGFMTTEEANRKFAPKKAGDSSVTKEDLNAVKKWVSDNFAKKKSSSTP